MRRLNGKKLLLNYWLLNQLGAERTTSSQELPSATPKHVQTCMHVQNSFSLSLLLACLHGVSGRGRDPQPSHGSATPVVLVRSWSLPLSLSLSFARAMVQGFDPPHRARSLSLSVSLSPGHEGRSGPASIMPTQRVVGHKGSEHQACDITGTER